ncbi:MAG: hypothetical protein C0415_04960 [Thermodesulfovibrio sp.]|nr:hypothetical protein [Thermodesulfovibrio sp.]
MKLIIKRDQKAQTGLLGGHKGMTFLLSCRVELTTEEKDLVTKYKAEYHPLTFTTDREGNKIPKDTISRLMQGVTEEMKDITILLNNEEVIKDACKNFKTLLDVMATFGGEEVVEY